MSVFKLKSSPYYYIKFRRANGKDARVSSKTRCKATARRMEARLVAEQDRLRRGEVTESELKAARTRRASVQSLLDSYLLRLRDRSPVHVAEVDRTVRRFVMDRGISSVEQVTFEEVVRWGESLERVRDKQAPLSKRTISKLQGHIRSMLRWAVKDGRLSENPLRDLEFTPPGERRYRALTGPELDRLLGVADEKGRGLWYRMALHAGCRRSDLARMTWDQVDLEAGVIVFFRGRAKARRRRDEVPIAAELRPYLEGARQHPAARVFPKVHTCATVRRDFERAGIERIDDHGKQASLHSLRVTLGTELARAGVAPQVSQRILRHANIATTTAYYLDLKLADTRAALDKLHLGGANTGASAEHRSQA